MKHTILFFLLWGLNSYAYTQIIGQFEDVQIGVSVSTYDIAKPEHNSLSILTDTSGNTNVLFMFPRDIYVCGGILYDRGRLVYTLSEDGGQTWDTGSGVISTHLVPPPPNHCFGLKFLDDAYTYPTQYPMGQMFEWEDSSLTSDIALSAVASVRDTNGQYYGNYVMDVRDLPIQFYYEVESYNSNLNPAQMESSGFVKRLDREFWYAAHSQASPDGFADVLLYRGVFDTLSLETNWQIAATIRVEHIVLAGYTAQQNRLNMAFSPDGSRGYVSWLGDIVGKSDSVLSPILIESTDGGNSWGEPSEIDLSPFTQLRDSVLSSLAYDTLSGTLRSIASGRVSTAYQHDLIVDGSGNPQLFTTVGAAELRDQAFEPYQFYDAAKMQNLSFTRDGFGDWSAIYVAPQRTFDFERIQPGGSFGIDPPTYQAVQPQISRSQDGKYIFYLWLDSDTLANAWTPLPKPVSNGQMTNIRPDLQLRVLETSTLRWSPIYNITQVDSIWQGKAFFPQLATEVIKEDDQKYRIPLVLNNAREFAKFYYYLDNLTFDITAIQSPASYLYNCKQSPLGSNLLTTQPNCGQNNGFMQAQISGGQTPYKLAWSTGDSLSLLSNLAAGFYQLAITDKMGCREDMNISLNNIGVPDLVIDSASMRDISCYGSNDGQARAIASDPDSSLIYMWSNGEDTPSVTNLPAGLNIVTILDSNGCFAYADVMIFEPDSIEIKISSIGLDCAGDVDGVVMALALGGTGSLSYDWGDAGIGDTIAGLGAGYYQVLVSDANACVDTAEVYVNEPEPISLNISSTRNDCLDCRNFDGSATADVIGGVSPYRIDWIFQSYNDTIFNTRFVFGLDNGDYVSMVTDANGCTIRDTFSIDGIGCKDNIEDELAGGISLFQVSPNPSHDLAQLHIELDQPGAVKIKLINLQGQIVQEIEIAPSQQIFHNLDVSALTAGVYFIQVETATARAAQRLMVE
ncbi:MAG: T9SS type A sorting domain-containing protein [Bacteroidia bacterium]